MAFNKILIVSSRLTTNLVKMGTTPLSGVFASVTIEYREETLSADVVKVNDERMSVFHRSPCPLVFGNADLVCEVFGGVSVQDLRNSGE